MNSNMNNVDDTTPASNTTNDNIGCTYTTSITTTSTTTAANQQNSPPTTTPISTETETIATTAIREQPIANQQQEIQPLCNSQFVQTTTTGTTTATHTGTTTTTPTVTSLIAVGTGVDSSIGSISAISTAAAVRTVPAIVVPMGKPSTEPQILATSTQTSTMKAVVNNPTMNVSSSVTMMNQIPSPKATSATCTVSSVLMRKLPLSSSSYIQPTTGTCIAPTKVALPSVQNHDSTASSQSGRIQPQQTPPYYYFINTQTDDNTLIQSQSHETNASTSIRPISYIPLATAATAIAATKLQTIGSHPLVPVVPSIPTTKAIIGNVARKEEEDDDDKKIAANSMPKGRRELQQGRQQPCETMITAATDTEEKGHTLLSRVRQQLLNLNQGNTNNNNYYSNMMNAIDLVSADLDDDADDDEDDDEEDDANENKDDNDINDIKNRKSATDTEDFTIVDIVVKEPSKQQQQQQQQQRVFVKYVPEIVSLTSIDIIELSTIIWDNIGKVYTDYFVAGCKANKNHNQMKRQYVRDFFLRKGYLHSDPKSLRTILEREPNNVLINNKLQYLSNATPTERHKLSSFDALGIVQAINVCETRIRSAYGPVLGEGSDRQVGTGKIKKSITSATTTTTTNFQNTSKVSKTKVTKATIATGTVSKRLPVEDVRTSSTNHKSILPKKTKATSTVTTTRKNSDTSNPVKTVAIDDNQHTQIRTGTVTTLPNNLPTTIRKDSYIGDNSMNVNNSENDIKQSKKIYESWNKTNISATDAAAANAKITRAALEQDVPLSTDEADELSNIIFQKLFEKYQEHSGGTNGTASKQFPQIPIKLKIVHSYLKNKERLHSLSSTVSRDLTPAQKQHLIQLNSIIVKRSLQYCEQRQHERLMQVSKEKTQKSFAFSTSPMGVTATVVSSHSNSHLVDTKIPSKTVAPDNGTSINTSTTTDRDIRLIIQLIEAEILRAVKVVAHSLQTGPWPSMHRSIEPHVVQHRTKSHSLSSLLGHNESIDINILKLLDEDDNANENKNRDDIEEDDNAQSTILCVQSMQAHYDHMSDVVASLNKFAQDIIRTKIIEDTRNTRLLTGHVSQQSDDDDDDDNYKEQNKTFLGTLLMLREVLIINAKEIFGASALLTGHENDFIVSGSNSTTENDSRRNNDAVDDTHAKDNAVYAAKLLATTVILFGLADAEKSTTRISGLVDAEKPSIKISSQFFELIAQYDGGDDAFAQFYRRADDNVIGVNPSDERLSECEMIAWRMSTNYNRERHPLIKKNRRKRKRQRTNINSQDDDASKQQRGSNASVFNSAITKIAITVPEPDFVHISILDNLKRAMTKG